MTMRWVCVILLISMVFLAGCDMNPRPPVNESSFIDYSQARENYTQKTKDKDIINDTIVIIDDNDVIIETPSDEDYLIGSFNVQIFGKAKATNDEVYPVIVDIIDDYDIIAIQEIRDISGTVVNKLNQIPNMHLKVSERLGRSSSKEQYAFLYSGRVTPGVPRQFPDPSDKFERPPYMMDFTLDNFRFVLIQVHIKPTDAEQEIRELEDVVLWAMREYNENDIFIIGDLNADCTYFDSFFVMSEYEWLIDEKQDTTVGRTDCAYDRIIATEANPNILEVGVDTFQDEIGTNRDLLEAVSDHYIVYFIYDKGVIV